MSFLCVAKKSGGREWDTHSKINFPLVIITYMYGVGYGCMFCSCNEMFRPFYDRGDFAL